MRKLDFSSSEDHWNQQTFTYFKYDFQVLDVGTGQDVGLPDSGLILVVSQRRGSDGKTVVETTRNRCNEIFQFNEY